MCFFDWSLALCGLSLWRPPCENATRRLKIAAVVYISKMNFYIMPKRDWTSQCPKTWSQLCNNRQCKINANYKTFHLADWPKRHRAIPPHPPPQICASSSHLGRSSDLWRIQLALEQNSLVQLSKPDGSLYRRGATKRYAFTQASHPRPAVHRYRDNVCPFLVCHHLSEHLLACHNHKYSSERRFDLIPIQ